MYPGVTNPYVRVCLATLDILMGLAVASIAVFTIGFWGRGIYRIIGNRDIFTGEKVLTKAA